MYRIWVANAIGEEYPIGPAMDNLGIAVEMAIFPVQPLRAKKIGGATVLVLAHGRGCWEWQV